MATAIPQNPTSQTVASLLPKLHEADPDFRFMSLNDLFQVLTIGHPGFLLNDYNTAARAVDGVLKTLDDQNGEVQNLAIKCLAPLVLKVPPAILPPLIEKLSTLSTKNSIDSSVPATALRTVVTTLPRPVPGVTPSKSINDAYAAISRVLIPRLVGYVVIPRNTKQELPDPPPGLLEMDPNKGIDSDAIDVLIEVVRCFGPMLQVSEVQALEKAVMEILQSERTGSVVKKRAVSAISILAIYLSDDLLSSFVSQIIESLRNPHIVPVKRRLFITILGSLARSIPQRFGPYLKTLAPFILAAVSEVELREQLEEAEENGESDSETEEVREAALGALEGFLASCSNEMRPFTNESIDAGLRFLKYDPNYTDDEDDEEMGGTQDEEDDADGLGDDDDFEEEGGFSEDDDGSWKVRRCAAKVLYTIISTRASGDLLEDGTLYAKVAPGLIDRFKEREDNVRLEVLSTMAVLVRKTGEGTVVAPISAIDESYVAMAPPTGRKRRRGGSDASMFDTQARISLSAGLTSPIEPSFPATGPRADLETLSPSIIKAISKIWKGNSIPTKQTAISLIRDIVAVQRGGLAEYLNQLIDPVVEAVKTASGASAPGGAGVGGSASATPSSLRIEALKLLSAIAEMHTTGILQPYLAKVVPAVIAAAQDKFYKISGEAIGTVEQLVKVLTPPRSHLADQQHQGYIEKLYAVTISRITANDTDLEVRQRAIHAIGVLLARTSGSEGEKLLPAANRSTALDILSERLKNETTRIAAVKAIDTVATLTSRADELDPAWARDVSLELGAQLRKANRTLRGASLAALKNLVVSPAGRQSLDSKTVSDLVNVLSPLLTANDLHLLGPALLVLATLTRVEASLVVSQRTINSLCDLVKAPLGGAVLDALLILTREIGEQGVGQALMSALLKDVGVGGNIPTVGKVIGTLLVYGGSTVGVKLSDFTNELTTTDDDPRKCLALAILGEAGLRMGSSSPLNPDIFISFFTSKSDRVPLAAAVALGRAGAGDVQKYLSVILKEMDKSGLSQYLLLHSIKEILQHAGEVSTNIGNSSGQIWDKLFNISQAEDNKTVGAECIGRLTITEPKIYFPKLQGYLQDKEPGVRAIVIQALRYTLADTDESYDYILKPILVDMLTVMLGDRVLENRRLALTTLNSAAHNKPELILNNLSQLLPHVMKESTVNLDLIREVMMGPFKHKVDDGLEVRKSAYETLYALMEIAFTRMNIVEFYDRIIAGLGDEHDIRALCNLMLTKLIVLDPDETQRRLDAIGERFRAILSTKLKENAVKQEIEKADEANKGVLRVSVQLQKSFPAASSGASGGQHQIWRTYWEYAKKEFSTQVALLESESRQINAA